MKSIEYYDNSSSPIEENSNDSASKLPLSDKQIKDEINRLRPFLDKKADRENCRKNLAFQQLELIGINNPRIKNKIEDKIEELEVEL